MLKHRKTNRRKGGMFLSASVYSTMERGSIKLKSVATAATATATATATSNGRFSSLLQQLRSNSMVLLVTVRIIIVVFCFCCYYMYIYNNYSTNVSVSTQSVDEYNNNNYYVELIHAFDSVPEKIMSVRDIEEHMLVHNINTTSTPIVYFITPTVRTYTQYLDLVRLSQALINDRAIYWIIVEDRINCTQRIRNLLNRSGLLCAHTAILSPKVTLYRWIIGTAKGVVQRNRGLEIVESLTQQQLQHQRNDISTTIATTTTIINNNNNTHGIVYFGDDDNAYDIRLFNEIRKLQIGSVGVFGVAYTGAGTYERCVVNTTTGSIQQLLTKWPGPILLSAPYSLYMYFINSILKIKIGRNTTNRLYSSSNPFIRKFPVDMGGLAVSTKLINYYHPRFLNDSLPGFLETNFIEQFNLSNIQQLQPLLNNCTLMYVWHVRTHLNMHIPVYADSYYEIIPNLI